MTRTGPPPFNESHPSSEHADSATRRIPPRAAPRARPAAAVRRSEGADATDRIPLARPNRPRPDARARDHAARAETVRVHAHGASHGATATATELPAQHEARTGKYPVAGQAGSSASRVRGIDAARGLALLGMIAVHTLPLSDESGTPTATTRIAGGTAAALFAVLAGVSVALLTGRRRVEPGGGRAARQAVRLVVRGLAIGAFGLALGGVNPGDVDLILAYYGVLFLLAVPLVFLSTRTLFVLGAALVVVAPITDFLLRRVLPVADPSSDPSFTELVSDPAGLLSALLFTGTYPAWPWLAYLCVGIAVGRCSLDRTRIAAWLAASGVLIAVAAAVISYVALVGAGGLDHILANPGLPEEELRSELTEGPNGVTPTTTWWWLAVDTPHSSTPLDIARTIGTSLAALGTMLLLDRALDRARSSPLGRVGSAARSPLAAAGSMTLTFYSLHVVFIGFAPEANPWVLYLLQVTFALLVGSLWRRAVGRGPLEASVSTLTDAVVPAPARSGASHEQDTRRTRIAIVVAAVAVLAALAVAGGVGLTLPGTPSDDPALPAETSQQADTSEPDDTPEAPAQPDTPESDDTPDDGPGQPDQEGEN